MDEKPERNVAITLGPGQLVLIILTALGIGGGGTSFFMNTRQPPPAPITLTVDPTLEHRLTIIEAKIDQLDLTIRNLKK